MARRFWYRLVLTGCCITAACSDALPIPEYSSRSVVPHGATEPGPLVSGGLVSIYGQHLGPDAPCTGTGEASRLCGTEVRVGGIAAGLLYVSSTQINFKVPQQVPAAGAADLKVSYKGRSGPAVPVAFRPRASAASAEQMVETIWSGLRGVAWGTPHRTGCTVVPAQSLRGGLYAYAYYCSQPLTNVIAESFYYPFGDTHPEALLLRADFTLANEYPEVSAAVERLLMQRLNTAYGPSRVPVHLFEIGNPNLSWRAGEVTIFLHHNRNYVAPFGVRTGVQLIAVRQEVLEQRELHRKLEQALGLAAARISQELEKQLRGIYFASTQRPRTDPERETAERDTRTALLRLLRQSEGDRARRAAILVAADDLAVRLGSLLITRSIIKGHENLGEAPNAPQVRLQLSSYGVRYTGPGHYSGDLEYDRGLLRRAWKEFPDTLWGQRAFLMLQRLSCQFECNRPNCFKTVIRQGEDFLRGYPDTPFRTEQLFHLALANETWWSLSQSVPGDPTAEGAEVDQASGERARTRAVSLYEELIRLAPQSPEAQAGRLVLPWLKMRLGTGERTFFCFTC